MTEGFDRVEEISHVVEFAIDARKSDVGDIVGFGEMLHHDLTDLCGGYLQFELRVDFGFDLLNHQLDLLAADRSFAASAFDTATDLFTIKRYATLIRLTTRIFASSSFSNVVKRRWQLPQTRLRRTT